MARHREQLYRTALRHLRNPDDAQDAVQEALLAAWRHHEQFRGESQWRTWLTRIVLNAAHTQRRRRRPVITLEAAAASWVPDPRPGPEALYTEEERHERFERLLARLSPPLRAAVKARVLEEQSLREAAGALGISLEALKCRLVRARARLARCAEQVGAATKRLS